jgi:hypothetical protein
MFWEPKGRCCFEKGSYLRLTLNVNRSGCAAKRRFRIVLLPAPLGPEMTIGRSLMSTGAIFAFEALESLRVEEVVRG